MMPSDAVDTLEGQQDQAETRLNGALADAAKLVVDYLSAMEARDLTLAARFIRDDFVMVFPGSAPMTSHQELIAWSAERYRYVKKAYAAVEPLQRGSSMVVYARGTLAGAWLDGEPFDGIRFIDRFELIEGKIVRLEVWNDIGEVRRA